MKRYFLFLIIIGTCFFLSCNWQKKGSGALPMELVQAENIMYENPDSALHILQGMEIPVEGEAHATWALLLTQAKYKCDILQSDSLVNIAYKYFIGRNNVGKKALVLYLKGGLLNESNQQDKALPYYIKAAEESENCKDYRLAYFINSHIARIYLYRKLYDYAMPYCYKAKDFALLFNKSYYIGDSYLEIARAFSVQNKQQLAYDFYEKAIMIGKNDNEKEILTTALSEIMFLYIKQKKYKEALVVASKIDRSQINLQGNFSLGYLYYCVNQSDSAYYYLNKAIQSDNIYTQRSIYQVLFNLSKKSNDYKRNAEYSVKLWEINDSIHKIDRNKALIEMQEKYNQQKVINEKDKAEKRGLIILCVSIGIIGGIVLWYQWKVLQQNKELEDKRKELDGLKEQLAKNQETIAQNEKRIDMVANQKVKEATEELHEKEMAIQNMKKQNEDLEKENQGLQKRIEQHESALQEKTKDTTRLNLLIEQNQYLHVRENFLVNQLLKTNKLVCRLKREPDGLKNNKEWKELIEMTNLVYNGYTERLLEKVPTLTENDIRICCLIKLSFSNVDMADILGISPTSVSRQKLRLKERIIQHIGSLGDNVLLDIWLKEF